MSTNVVDFIIAAADHDQVSLILDELEARMKIKRQGEIHFLLMIAIQHDKNAKTNAINQELYATKVFDRFGMLGCAGRWAPEGDDTQGLWHCDQQPNADATLYPSNVGCLM